jgi:hypothetical protein
VLACADHVDNRAVAERFGISAQTVGKWRFRFLRRRLDGLVDGQRPGAPRKVTDDVIERVIAETVEDKPAKGRPWSARSLAEITGLSHSTVLRIWAAHGIRPAAEEGLEALDPQGRPDRGAPLAGQREPLNRSIATQSRPRQVGRSKQRAYRSWWPLLAT